MVVWDGENACVYEVNMESKTVNKTAEFQCASSIMCIYEQSIFSVEPTKLQVRNLQVRVRLSIAAPRLNWIAF